jgi:hypothetical protein
VSIKLNNGQIKEIPNVLHVFGLQKICSQPKNLTKWEEKSPLDMVIVY